MDTSTNTLVSVVSGHVVTTSRKIADLFGKLHKNVIRDIENLLGQLTTDHKLNFGPMVTKVGIGSGATRDAKAYSITRDGFTLLAMGFTGAKALQFKLAFIDAFNAMEAELRRLGGTAKQGTAAHCHPDARRQLQCAVRAVLAHQPKLTYQELYRRVHLEFSVNSADDLGARLPEAVAYVHGLAASWELVDAPVLPAPTPTPGLDASLREVLEKVIADAEFVRSWWNTYGPPLEQFYPHATGQVSEHIVSAAVGCRALVRALNLKSLQQYAAGYPWRGDAAARRAYGTNFREVAP